MCDYCGAMLVAEDCPNYGYGPEHAPKPNERNKMDIYEYVFMGHVSGVRVDHVISLHEECLADLQVGVDTTYAKRAKEAFMACAWPLCPEKQAWTEKQAQQLREMVAE